MEENKKIEKEEIQVNSQTNSVQNDNKIKLEDVLQICRDFIENPEDKQVLENYNNMLMLFTIRSYLTMQEKVLALVRMTIDSDKSYDIEPSFFTAGLELACCFDGLLSYVNIEPSIDISIKNYENYDLLYQSGVADYILQYCEKDYNRLVRMMERTMSFENLQELTESISLMDKDVLEDFIDEIKETKKDINPNVIKDMADIMRYNDPNLYNLKESLEDEALEKLEKMDKIDKVNK